MYIKLSRKQLLTAFLYIFTLTCYNGLAGQNSLMDSLKNQLSIETNDTSRIDLFLDLSFGHHQIDVPLCKYYAEQAISLSESIKDSTRIGLAYNRLSIATGLEGNHSISIQHLNKSLDIAEDLNLDDLYYKSMHNLGVTYREMKKHDKAIECLLIALKFDEQRGSKITTITTLANIGELYLNLNDRTDKDLDQAEEYLTQAVEISNELGHPKQQTFPNVIMGHLFVEKGQYIKALKYLKSGHDLSVKYDQYLRTAISLRLMGISHHELGDSELSLELFQKAENILKQTGDNQIEMLNLYKSWADVFDQIGDYNNAFDKTNKGINVANTHDLKETSLAFTKKKGLLYEKTGNYKEALKYYKSASNQQDTLYIHEREKLVSELETDYQLNKKVIENELLHVQNHKTNSELQSKNTILNFILLVASLLSLIAFILLRANKLKNKYNDELQTQVDHRTTELNNKNIQLEQSNQELERFAFIASHDLKTPIRNIISFSSLLDRELENVENENAKEYLNFIIKGGKRMDKLIESILEFSKLTDPEVEQILESVNLNSICSEIINTKFKLQGAKEANIEIPHSLPTILSNYSSIYSLFQNLIENGLKYNKSAVPKITIRFIKFEDSFSLLFEDNGIGIPEEFLDNIMVMFSRLHNQSEYEGTGLGLAICNKIMKSFDGSINVSSKESQGSTFELVFPIKYLEKASTPILNS